MSIASDALRKAGPFAGDGTTVTFPFSFKVFSASDVLVVLTSAAGVESELSSGYTVSMNADQETSPGGTVTMVTAPATGELLTLGSQVAATQLVKLTNAGGFYPDVINTALDKLTALVQQLKEEMSRTLKIGISSSAAATPDALVAALNSATTTAVAAASTLTSAVTGYASSAGASLIGFIQAGANATARTIQDRLRETVSVKDFGAVGDGVADEYAAFSAALTYLGTLAFGGWLVVPDGKYRFAKQGSAYPSLGIPSRVSIVASDSVEYLVDASGLANSGVHIYGTALFTNNDWATTGNRDIAIIGGKFKSLNATSGATGNGGFIAFKNCLRPVVEGVQLLDTFGAARLQLSFCQGARLLRGVVDYDAPHLTPWSYEDGLRIGSGCQDAIIDGWVIKSGDDCIAINNEASECQDAFSSPVDSRIPASSVTGANITGVIVSNVHCANENGNAVRIYIGPGMTAGAISKVRISNVIAKTKSPSAGGTVVSMLDSGSAGHDQIYDVEIRDSEFDCANLTPSGSPGAIQVGAALSDVSIDNVALVGVTTTYGVTCGVRQKVRNCRITGCVNDAIYVSTANCQIIDNQISGPGVAGIHLDNGASHTLVHGNRVLSSTGAAILESAGADYTLAIGNDVAGAGAVNVAAAGAHSVYKDNIGYNPVGSFAIGVGASPFTYTTGCSPETVTVGGGTVSNITINGVGMAINAGAFHVPPHTSIIVTYSVGPTMTKHIH